MKKSASTPASFEHIQAFLDHSRGQITIGEIPPIRSAALAAVGKKVHVAPVRRDGETVAELLLRLEAALGKTSADKTVIDEVLPEIKRGRAPKKGT
jgi:hypothetical protein